MLHDCRIMLHKMLYWLPVQLRLQFKVKLMTFKVLNGHAPAYLADLIKIQQPKHQLRSSAKYDTGCPRDENHNIYGDLCFSFAAPALWNTIPEAVKQSSTVLSFKKTFKKVSLTVF